ncbi:unnamed protein product [Linum trigynum]|uniref:Uncharacterized protein n=1 Tax=Linum trigynum TaxID=586398 RepID=A0AAV2DHN7_9ROSI
MKLQIPSRLLLLFIVSMAVSRYLCLANSASIAMKMIIKSRKMASASVLVSSSTGSHVHQHYFVDNFRGRALTAVDGPAAGGGGEVPAGKGSSEGGGNNGKSNNGEPEVNNHHNIPRSEFGGYGTSQIGTKSQSSP